MTTRGVDFFGETACLIFTGKKVGKAAGEGFWEGGSWGNDDGQVGVFRGGKGFIRN